MDGISPVSYVGVTDDTYHYRVDVLASTTNGSHTITVNAEDALGNASSDSSSAICLNKNQITGSVELEAFIGTTRTVTFVSNGGDKTLTPILSFTDGVAEFTLTDVPQDTTTLSAKADWNLRVKVSGQDMSADDGQETADFTDANKLRGGDLNGTNTINILDYAVLRNNWFTYNTVADINGDGKVALQDYALLRANWFQAGDAK